MALPGSPGRNSPPAPARRSPWARWRPLLTGVVAIPLLLGGLAVSPSEAAQRPVDHGAGQRVPKAQADESPSPSPEPTPKPTPWPTPDGLKGVDVSHWNGFPDFEKLYAKGMRFVISKASQGTSFVDDTYKRHSREARQAGLKVGAYHFFDYTTGGTAQARHFLDTVRETTGLGSLLPLVVDVETLKSLGTPDKAKAKLRLHGLMDELYRQTGRYPMIYTSRSMWDRVVGSPTGFGKYPLWVACWKCDDILLPAGWSDWDFWQVGFFRFGNGLKLDGNVFRHGPQQLLERRASPLEIDGGAEWTADRTVLADLRGFDGEEVRYAAGEERFGSWQPFQKRVELKLGTTQGEQEVRVQLRSFRGIKTASLREDIKLDSVAPTVDGPKVAIRTGARVIRSGGRIPTRAVMTASDETSGLASSTLTATCDGVTRASRFRNAASIQLPVSVDRRGCTIEGSATDAVGHRTTNRLQPDIGLIDARAGSSKVSFSGGWKTLRNRGALNRTLARSSQQGATMELEIEGSQFAVVARRGPSGGRVGVSVDGKRLGTIDLYASKGDARRLVYVRTVPYGQHTVTLEVTGTGSPESSGAVVWLDAVLVLDRRT